MKRVHTFSNNGQSSGPTDVRMRFKNKDIIRKRIPRGTDQTDLQSQKHLALIPYNVQNNFVTPADIETIFAEVGIKVEIHDLALYQKAFVHSSYTYAAVVDDSDSLDEFDARGHLCSSLPALKTETYLPADFDLGNEFLMPLQKKSNERLEYLGDSVCGQVVATYLYKRYQNEDEGFMTRLRTRLVCGSKLGFFAEKLGLQKHVILSRYVELVNTGRSNYKVLEDIFEAFIGALYLDNGEDSKICYRFIVAIMEKWVDFPDLIANDENHKDKLLRAFQRFFDGSYPIYKEVSVDVQDGRKVYTMGVLNPEGTQIVGVGSHQKKRLSEQLASLKALEYYGWADLSNDLSEKIENDINDANQK